MLAVPLVQAQDFEQIRQQIRERQEQARNDIEFLKNEISRIESELGRTATEYQERYRQFQQLEREITLRDQVLERLREEKEEIENEIELLQNTLKDYRNEFEKMVENYQTIIRHLYMHGRESEIMLLVTASSFNDLQVKAYYLRKFQEYRERQAEQITEAMERIEIKEKEMGTARERNSEVLTETNQERRRLDERRRVQGSTIAELQRDRRSLEEQLQQKRQQEENLNRMITNLIAEEERIRREEEEQYQLLEQERLRRLAEAEAIQNPQERERQMARFSEPIRRPESITLSAEEQRLIGQAFRSSRGKLPWPVEEGVISVRFGNKVDPVFRTTVPNYGIEIATEPQTPVRVVHDGIVYDVVPVTGYDTMIIVNHGGYITAYGNLTDVYVRRNSVVRTGDIIGRSGDENSFGGPMLFFLIRDGDRNVDPQQWITARPGPVP